MIWSPLSMGRTWLILKMILPVSCLGTILWGDFHEIPPGPSCVLLMWVCGEGDGNLLWVGGGRMPKYMWERVSIYLIKICSQGSCSQLAPLLAEEPGAFVPTLSFCSYNPCFLWLALVQSSEEEMFLSPSTAFNSTRIVFRSIGSSK